MLENCADKKLYCILHLVSSLFIFTCLFFCIYNYAAISDFHDIIFENDGIPGTAAQRVVVRKLVDALYVDIEQLEKKGHIKIHDGGGGLPLFPMNPAKERGQNGTTHPSTTEKLRVTTEPELMVSNDELVENITDLLRKNFKKEMNTDALNLKYAVKSLDEDIEQTSEQISKQMTQSEEVLKLVRKTAMRQLPAMLSKTFKQPVENLEMVLVRDSVRKVKEICPREFAVPNWAVYIKQNQTARDAMKLCYSNGGEWMDSATWEHLLPLLRGRQGPNWGHMFKDTNLNFMKMKNVRCDESPKKQKDKRVCKFESRWKPGPMDKKRALKGKFSYVYDHSGTYVWFADANDKKRSFCFIWRMLLRWGFDEQSLNGLTQVLEKTDHGTYKIPMDV